MLRTAALLTVLWLLAGGAWAAAVAAHVPGMDLVVLGMGLGQVQLLAFALVFVRRWLWLRLAALAAVICYWSAVTPVYFPETAMFIGCLYVSVALLAAGFCGVNHLLGLRLVEGAVATTNSPVMSESRRGQFSLATVLLATGILGVYLGLLRAAGIDRQSALVLLAVLVLSVPGCLVLTISAMRAPARTRCVAIIGLYYLALLMMIEFRLEHLLIQTAGIVLTVQLLIVGIAVAVLRVAGVRLVRREFKSDNNRSAPSDQAAELSCARGG
jgi:hypothetical protein